MRRHSRLLSLVLATTLVVTQVPTTFLPTTVYAGQTEEVQDTQNIIKDIVVWNPDSVVSDYYSFSEDNSVLTDKVTFSEASTYVYSVNVPSTYVPNVKIDADKLYALVNRVAPSASPSAPAATPAETPKAHTVSNPEYSYQWYQLKDGNYEKLDGETGSYYYPSQYIYNDVDVTVYKCVMTLESAYIDGELWSAQEDDDFKIQFEYIKEYDYEGVTAEKIASGQAELSSYYELDFSFDDETINYEYTSSVKYPKYNEIYNNKSDAKVEYSFVPTFRDGDTYAVESFRSDTVSNFNANDYSLPYVIYEDKTDEETGKTSTVKHYVYYYTLNINYIYGKRVIGNATKKYIANYEGILASDVAKNPAVLDKYFSNIGELSGQDKIYFTDTYSDKEIELGTYSKDYDADIKYVVYAYDASGNKVKVKEQSTGDEPYFYAEMYKSFDVYDEEGYVDSVYNPVAYYEVNSTLRYGDEELITYTKKYDVAYSPIKVNTPTKSEFSARLNEKKMLTVEAYSAVDDEDEYIGEITYQWYKVDKDGKETAIEDETSKNLYVTVSDYTVSYKCVISATNIVDGKYNNKVVEVPTVTFIPKRSAGYLLKKIDNMSGKAFVGDSYKMGIESVVDSGNTLTYSWDKISIKDEKLVYTPIENATSNYLSFDALKDSDFVKVYDYDLDRYVSYRLTVNVNTDEKVSEQYYYYFTLNKDYKDDIEIDSNMYNSSYSHVNSEIWTTIGKPVDLYVNAKINNSNCTIDSTTWYKQIAEVKYTAKKDENGEYIYQNNSVEWTTEDTTKVPEKEKYQWTTVEENEYDYAEGHYVCVEKTVYYYSKINAADNTAKYTVNSAAGDNGYYLCTLSVTETNVTESGSTKNTEYINFKKKVCFGSGFKAYVKADNVYAAVGKKADLSVVASNADSTIYPISYQWAKYDAEKTGKYVDIKDATSATYSIAEVKASDYGRYRVEVKDTSDKEATYLYITLADNIEEPVFITSRENYYNKKTGDDVKLKVDAKIPTNVNVDYTWYRSENYIKKTYDYDYDEYNYVDAVDENWQLIGQNADEYSFNVKSDDDLTTYRCEARYKINGEYVTKTFYFYVQDDSYISVENASLSTQYKNIGDSATYGVKVVSGNVDVKNIKYTWSRLTDDDSYEVIEGANDASYTINSLSEKDFSTLRVEISYSDKHESEYKYFNTRLNTDITLENYDDAIKANEGENVTLKAPIVNPSNKTNITYQWYSERYGIIYGANTAEYTISGIGSNEFGEYYCKIYESGYNINTYYVYVNENTDEEVITLKIADDGSYEVEKGLGDSVTLKVEATSSNNNELVYQWYFEDQAIGGATSATYTIDTLTKHDIGNYTCVVKSVDNKFAGEDSIIGYRSIDFYVDVTSGLKVENGYLYDDDVQGYKVKIGDTVTLTANATVDSDKYNIFYQWYADGKRIHGATSSTLTLTNIVAENLGYYTCEVTDANYSTKELSYYVYCDTGLYVNASVEHPIAGADGKISMYVNATANEGEKISYTWFGYDENDEKVILSNESSYTVDKLLKNTIKKVYVNVSTSGESLFFEYDLGTVYKTEQNRMNALVGDDLTFETSMYNKIEDAEYTYKWYERDNKTRGWKKLDNTKSSYSTKAPAVSIEDSSVPYAVKEYRVYTYCDGDEVKNDIFSVKVYSNVTFSTTTLPESTHNMTDRFDIKGYTIPGANEMVITFENTENMLDDDVYILDSEGNKTYVNKEKYVVKGDKVIVVCENSNSYGLNYGYKVVSIVDPESATVSIEDKKATYNGKAVSVSPAKVTASDGDVKYTYYTDKDCSVMTSKKANGAASNGAAPVYAGTYYVKAELLESGDYYSQTSNIAVVTIIKAKQKVSGVAVTKTYKAAVVAKKSQAFSLKGSSTAKTKLTFKKASGNKNIVISKTGKVTVKKGLKKGTYKVKVKVTAASNANYNKVTVTKVITVKVK